MRLDHPLGEPCWREDIDVRLFETPAKLLAQSHDIVRRLTHKMYHISLVKVARPMGISLPPVNVVIANWAAALEPNNLLNILVPIFDRKDLWIFGHGYNSGFVYRSNTVFTTPGLDFINPALATAPAAALLPSARANSRPPVPLQALTRRSAAACRLDLSSDSSCRMIAR